MKLTTYELFSGVDRLFGPDVMLVPVAPTTIGQIGVVPLEPMDEGTSPVRLVDFDYSVSADELVEIDDHQFAAFLNWVCPLSNGQEGELEYERSHRRRKRRAA